MILQRISSAILCLLLVTIGASAQKSVAGNFFSNATPSTGLTATVQGVVRLTGPPPPATKIDMSADPACENSHTETTEEIVADDGRLANALVYIKEARDTDVLTPNSYKPPQTKAVISIDNCLFRPHVVAFMTGQELQIVNRGKAVHHLYALTRSDPEFDIALLPKTQTPVIVPKQTRLMMPLASDGHPWMRMYVSLFPHPFFAVTGRDGQFRISGLPPGRYTIAVLHEKLGEEARQIEVGPKQEKIVDFSFNAASIH